MALLITGLHASCHPNADDSNDPKLPEDSFPTQSVCTQGPGAPVVSQVWTYDAGGPVVADLKLSNGILLVATMAGRASLLFSVNGAEQFAEETPGPAIGPNAILTDQYDGRDIYFVGLENDVQFVGRNVFLYGEWNKSDAPMPLRVTATSQYGFADVYPFPDSSNAVNIRHCSVYKGYWEDRSSCGIDYEHTGNYPGFVQAACTDDVCGTASEVYGVPDDQVVVIDRESFSTEGHVQRLPAIADERTFLVNEEGKVETYSVFWATRGQALWTFTSESGPIRVNPTVSDGTLYVSDESGTAYALAAETGEIRWCADVGSPVHTTATVYDQVVYIGSDDGSVHALSSQDGSFLWSYATQGPVTAAVVVEHSTAYVGSQDGYVYALRAE
jgi:hypothetical protein